MTPSCLRPMLIRLTMASVCVLTWHPCLCAQLVPPQAESQQMPSQTVFEFRNGFWLNLHHVLYEQARRQVANTQGAGGRPWPNVLDMTGLAEPEAHAWHTALHFYATAMVQRDLLFDEGMTAIKLHLSEVGTAPELPSAGLPEALTSALAQAAPVYRQYWWAAHAQANDTFIQQATALVARFGSAVPPQLVRLFKAPWPEGRIPVDVVRYANWAGAFTSIKPTPHITIASLDERHQGYLALEVLFHEASHALVDARSGAVGAGIQRECDAQNKPVPRDLWHAVLFYTTGEVVKRRLAEDGIRAYVPYAYQHRLYTRSWTRFQGVLEQAWQPYLDGTISFEDALRNVVAAL
jgi:hypothetical protein